MRKISLHKKKHRNTGNGSGIALGFATNLSSRMLREIKQRMFPKMPPIVVLRISSEIVQKFL